MSDQIATNYHLIKDAIENKKILKCTYTDIKRKKTSKTLEPYAMVQGIGKHENKFYISIIQISGDFTEGGLNCFKPTLLSGFSEIEISEVTFIPSRDFNVHNPIPGISSKLIDHDTLIQIECRHCK